MDNALALIPYFAMILGPGGAAYMAVKVGLNGAREDIKEIKQDIGHLQEDVEALKEDAAYARGLRASHDRKT